MFFFNRFLCIHHYFWRRNILTQRWLTELLLASWLSICRSIHKFIWVVMKIIKRTRNQWNLYFLKEKNVHMCLVIGKLQFTTANFHVVMSKMSAQFYCFVLGIVLYSEENVWKLCQDASLRVPEELDRCYVVFISNPCRTVPLWKQRAGREEDRLVIWVCTYRNCVMHAIPT